MEIPDEKYQRLIELSKELDELLTSGVSFVALDEAESKEYWNRRLRVLCDVMKKGGVVTKIEWGEIGKMHGYDRRGLGGYFAGNGTMTQIFGGKKTLTEEGASQVKSYLNGTHWSGAKPTDKDFVDYASLID